MKLVVLVRRTRCLLFRCTSETDRIVTHLLFGLSNTAKQITNYRDFLHKLGKVPSFNADSFIIKVT